jgi:hypothetical protein
VILADQAAEDLPALDPGGDIDGVAGLALRRFLLQALVRTVLVVVPGVLGQDTRPWKSRRCAPTVLTARTPVRHASVDSAT